MKIHDWSPDRIAKLVAVSITKAQARLLRARTGLTIITDAEDVAAKLIVNNIGAVQNAHPKRIISDLALVLIRRTFHKNGRPLPKGLK